MAGKIDRDEMLRLAYEYRAKIEDLEAENADMKAALEVLEVEPEE